MKIAADVGFEIPGFAIRRTVEIDYKPGVFATTLVSEIIQYSLLGRLLSRLGEADRVDHEQDRPYDFVGGGGEHS